MRDLVRSGRFRRDLKRVQKRGKDMSKLRAALSLLMEDQPLPPEYGDHPLRGEWKGWRDLHIGPDWLLIYRIEGDEVRLNCTGTHADIFEE